MKKRFTANGLFLVISLLVLTQCTTKTEKEDKSKPTVIVTEYGGFKTQVAWGKHLVTIMACGDCHTPKKMTAQGPVDDSTLLLSGHPAKMPAPDVNRKEMEQKGLTVTNTLTAWVGPWGVSYAANLTSDATGTGNWQESNFIVAIRQGKYKGIVDARPLMPPMPWLSYSQMTDDELKAVFAYLKSTKPINNVVPSLEPPALNAKQAGNE